MPKPSYRIEFYQVGTLMSNRLETDELYETIERSIFIVESLVFFITSINKEALDEIDYVSYSNYLGNINELIENFTNYVLNNSERLEERRKELEAIVANLPKVQ